MSAKRTSEEVQVPDCRIIELTSLYDLKNVVGEQQMDICDNPRGIESQIGDFQCAIKQRFPKQTLPTQP